MGSLNHLLGVLGKTMPVTLEGRGFDANTRGSIYLDSVYTEKLIGSVETLGQAIGLAMANDNADVADGSKGLQVMDIGNPESPGIIGSVNTRFIFHGLVWVEEYQLSFAI